MIYNINKNNNTHIELIEDYVTKNYYDFNNIVVTDITHLIDDGIDFINVDFYCNDNCKRGYVKFESIRYYAYLLRNDVISFDEFNKITSPERRTPESILCDILNNTDITRDNFFTRNTDVIVVVLLIATFIIFTFLWVQK